MTYVPGISINIFHCYYYRDQGRDYYFKKTALLGCYRVDAHYQSEDPNHAKATHRINEEKEKTVEDKNWKISWCQQKTIDYAFKTRQSLTIEYAVNKIVS